MTLSRRKLEWLLRVRGTDFSVWPERERVAALSLLRTSARARRALADALVGEEAPEADGDVLARMQAVLRRSLAPLPFLLRSLRAGALLACVVAGVYFGAGVQDPETAPDLFASAQTVSFAAIDQ